MLRLSLFLITIIYLVNGSLLRGEINEMRSGAKISMNGMAGGWSDADINDPRVQEIAIYAINLSYSIKDLPDFKILSAKKQVVAGINYSLVLQVNRKGYDCVVEQFFVLDRFGSLNLMHVDVLPDKCPLQDPNGPPNDGQGPPPNSNGPPNDGQGPPPNSNGPPNDGQGPPPNSNGPPNDGQGPPPNPNGPPNPPDQNGPPPPNGHAPPPHPSA